jgi:release factor glutamine methyltransferase
MKLESHPARTDILHGERDLRSALAGGVAQLTTRGVPSSALAAELLLLHVLGRDRAWLYAHPEQKLSTEELNHLLLLLERRAAGEPTQYLTGRQEFWGLEFAVTPDVLIPRPETEHVVEVALERLGAHRKEPLRIADVGTGSGCLAVALACEFSRAQVMATDISAPALQVARGNAAHHGVGNRIRFVQMNLLTGCIAPEPEAVPPKHFGPPFDLVVSNPPYIGYAEAAELAPEVRDHEPHAALFAGPTGVELYRDLIGQALELLAPEGILIVEVGHDAAQHIRELFGGDGWTDIATACDLAGIERIVSARRVVRTIDLCQQATRV